MTSNITVLYNAITNAPNAMAHICQAENDKDRAAFLVTMGDSLNLPVTPLEALDFLTTKSLAAKV